MRRIMSLLVVFIMVLMCVSQTIEAQTTDTFNITITVNFLAIDLDDWNSIDYATWAIGTVAGGVATTMSSNAGADASEEGVWVINTSNVAVDLTCRVSSEGADWLVAGTAGADAFKLEAEAYTAYQAASVPTFTGNLVVLTTSAQNLEAAVTAGADRYVYYRLTAPTSTTSPSEQTIQIEIGVTP